MNYSFTPLRKCLLIVLIISLTAVSWSCKNKAQGNGDKEVIILDWTITFRPEVPEKGKLAAIGELEQGILEQMVEDSAGGNSRFTDGFSFNFSFQPPPDPNTRANTKGHLRLKVPPHKQVVYKKPKSPVPVSRVAVDILEIEDNLLRRIVYGQIIRQEK